MLSYESLVFWEDREWDQKEDPNEKMYRWMKLYSLHHKLNWRIEKANYFLNQIQLMALYLGDY